MCSNCLKIVKTGSWLIGWPGASESGDQSSNPGRREIVPDECQTSWWREGFINICSKNVFFTTSGVILTSQMAVSEVVVIANVTVMVIYVSLFLPQLLVVAKIMVGVKFLWFSTTTTTILHLFFFKGASNNFLNKKSLKEGNKKTLTINLSPSFLIHLPRNTWKEKNLNQISLLVWIKVLFYFNSANRRESNSKFLTWAVFCDLDFSWFRD